MKKHIFLFIIMAVLLAAMVSCVSLKNKAATPEEALIMAMLNGEDLVAEGLTYKEDINFDQIFESRRPLSIYINSTLRFRNCTFKGKVSWAKQENRRLHFLKDVIFEDCEFEEDVVINDAVFKSIFQIGNSLFKKSLDLQRNSFFLKCRIDDNDIGQDLIIQYSRCHEDVSLFGNTIGNHLLLQAISVQGKTQLSNLQLNGTVDISNAHFHEDFMMDYTRGGKKVLAGNSKFFSRSFIRNITAFEKIDFSGSYFLGKRLYTVKGDPISTSFEDCFFLNESP